MQAKNKIVLDQIETQRENKKFSNARMQQKKAHIHIVYIYTTFFLETMSFDEGAVFYSDQGLVERTHGGGSALYQDKFFRFIREYRHESSFIYR